MTESTAPCGATYTSRDGGSTLVCTEPAGHGPGGLDGTGHYAGGLPSWGERGPQTGAEYDDLAPCADCLWIASHADDCPRGPNACPRCHGTERRVLVTRTGSLNECRGCGLVWALR
jgi:hypothetical protein